MTSKSADTIVSRDRRGRRDFLQKGAMLVAAASVASASRVVAASDCDQSSSAERARCSDSDSSGTASGDPAICGCESPEVPARYHPEDKPAELLLKVAKVR